MLIKLPNHIIDKLNNMQEGKKCLVKISNKDIVYFLDKKTYVDWFINFLNEYNNCYTFAVVNEKVYGEVRVAFVRPADDGFIISNHLIVKNEFTVVKTFRNKIPYNYYMDNQLELFS